MTSCTTKEIDPISPVSSQNRKTGLAKLAKARSLSRSSGSLHEIDSDAPLGSPGKSSTSSSEIFISPLRQLTKQSGPVSILPNKMNVSSLSGQLSSDRRSKGSEEDSTSLDSCYAFPRSDPEFMRGRSSLPRSFMTLPSIVSQNTCTEQSTKRNSAARDREDASLGLSSPPLGVQPPVVGRRTLLEPPMAQAKRSSSLSRLSEALQQMHSVLLHPAVAIDNHSACDTQYGSNEEKIISRQLTPSMASVSCNNTISPDVVKMIRQDAIRRDSNGAKGVGIMSDLGDYRTRQERAGIYCPLKQDGPMNGNIPVGSSSNYCSFDNDQSLEDSTHRKSRGTERSKKNAGKKTENPVGRAARDTTLSPTSLLMPFNAEDGGHLRRSASCYGTPEEMRSMQESSSTGESQGTLFGGMNGLRSASLDELDHLSSKLGLGGLPILSAIDAKRKNFLVGGLTCLLGASELDRYIPGRTISMFIATWNMNGKEPPSDLEDFLLPDSLENIPDVFVVGTQESGGDRGDWEVKLQATIGPSHVLYTSSVFGVLHLTIFIRRDLIWFCSSFGYISYAGAVPEDSTYSVRPGIAYKTKGCVAIGFQLFGTRLLFINSHLTAHEDKVAQRVQNFKSIVHSLDLPKILPVRHKHKNVTHHYDSVFWIGDLNFRLAAQREYIVEKLTTCDTPDSYEQLLQWDQLTQTKKKGEAFSDFEEGKITFAPTFKFDVDSDEYDSSSKFRVPSYTDRILFRSTRESIKCLNYDSFPTLKTSDHKPVWGVFECKLRPGKDDVPLAAGLFNRDVYLQGLKRRRRFFHQPSTKYCSMQ